MPAPVRLRPILPADLPILYQFQLDPESNALAAVNPRDLDTFNAIYAKILGDAPEMRRTTARAIIADDGTGAPTLVGSISCFQRDGLDYIGYWIDRAGGHWGKGYATRAVALLLEEVKTRPLHARVATHNAASLRVLERNGFVITSVQHSPATERFRECDEAILVLA